MLGECASVNKMEIIPWYENWSFIYRHPLGTAAHSHIQPSTMFAPCKYK
jgi:hypothetical protein